MSASAARPTGHTAIRPYSEQFRVVGSTETSSPTTMRTSAMAPWDNYDRKDKDGAWALTANMCGRVATTATVNLSRRLYAGETIKVPLLTTFTVNNIVDDNTAEGTESFDLILNAGPDYNVGSPGVHTGGA